MTMQKLKTIKQKLIALSLAATLSTTTGCKINDDRNFDIKRKINNEYDLNDNNLEAESTDEFIKSINNIKTEYESLSKEEIVDLYNSSLQNKECQYKFNGSIEELIDQISENTEDYVDEHEEYISAFDMELKDIDIEMILYNIIDNLIKKSNNNIDEDMHKLSKLKLIITKEDRYDCLGSYNCEEELITIYIRPLYTLYGYNLEEQLELTLAHEINHARQVSCDCINNSKYNNMSFSDNETSSLIEASAESELYNLNKYNCDYSVYSYEEQRQDESLVILLGAFDNENINEYYNAIFDTNYRKLYNYCDIKTKTDVFNFYNIMYAIDHDINSNNYKIDIFKKTIINLYELNEQQELSLEENLSLFILIKNIITTPKENEKIDSSKDFVSEFIKLECIYNNYLKEKYNTTDEYIYDYENQNSTDLLMDAISISQGYEAYYNTQAENLLEKFQILKSVIYPNVSYLPTSYSDFTQKNSKQYKK